MSDERLRYIEVLGEAPAAASEGRDEAQRAAFQAARRSAEALATEAELRITGVQQIAEIKEEGDAAQAHRVRYRVRFGIEPAKNASKRAGFYTIE